MKVPVYEQQVTPAPAAAPSVPNFSGAPAAAFGTGVAQEIERAGETVNRLGSVVAEHGLLLQREKEQSDITKADTELGAEINNALFSDEVDDNNVPKGLLNRKLAQANGATQELDQRFAAMQKNYVSKFQKPRLQQEMAKILADKYAQARGMVIKHEGTEDRENKKNILQANLDQQVTNAGLIGDANTFLRTIQTGHDRQYALMKQQGFDDASITNATSKFADDMVKGKLGAMVQPDPAPALAFLESVKSVLSPTQYAENKKAVLTQSKQMANLLKENKELAYDANLRTAMLDLMDGKLTLSELQRRYRNEDLKEGDYNMLEGKLVKPDYEFLRKLKVSDPEQFTRIREAQLSGAYSEGELNRMLLNSDKITPDDQKYLQALNKGFPATANDQAIDARAKTIEQFATNFFTKHLSDIVPPIVGENIPSAVDKEVKADETAKLVAGLKAEFYKRVDQEKATGERVDAIAHEVMTEHVKKNHPGVSRLEDIPHVVVTVNGRIKRLMDPTDKSKLKGQFRITPTGTDDTKKPEPKKANDRVPGK